VSVVVVRSLYMHTLLSVLLVLGLIGGLILELWLVIRVLAALTSRHLPAQRDFDRPPPGSLDVVSSCYDEKWGPLTCLRPEPPGQGYGITNNC